jgi:hypothetical protein
MPNPDFDAARKWAEKQWNDKQWPELRNLSVSFLALESRVAALTKQRDEAIALLTRVEEEGDHMGITNAIRAFIAAHKIGS